MSKYSSTAGGPNGWIAQDRTGNVPHERLLVVAAELLHAAVVHAQAVESVASREDTVAARQAQGGLIETARRLIAAHRNGGGCFLVLQVTTWWR